MLVLGATGSVGLVAVQAAKLLGAGRVVAAGRDTAGLELAAERGPTCPAVQGKPTPVSSSEAVQSRCAMAVSLAAADRPTRVGWPLISRRPPGPT